MEALNQTSSSLPLLGKLRACSQRQAVAAASMSVRRVKLWNDVGCKVLHINLFTAVLVTLIIQHGSSSHIEGVVRERTAEKEKASIMGVRRDTYTYR